MAKRGNRARSSKRNAEAGRPTGDANVGGGIASVIPRVLLGAVNGVEVVAVGALQFTRDVLLTTVSGAANIGAEALTATTAGARGVVSATSRMVVDIAGTAESTFRDALNNAKHARRGPARMAPRSVRATDSGDESDARTSASPTRPRAGRRTRRQRPVSGPRTAA